MRDVTVAATSEWPPRSAKKWAPTDSWPGSMPKTSAHTSRTQRSVSVRGGSIAPLPPTSRGLLGSGSCLRSTLPLGSIGSSSTHSRKVGTM